MQVALLLAHEDLERDLGPHGIPLSVATDPANEFKFNVPALPTVDHAARALAKRQDAYYADADAKSKTPVSRAGHLWGVELTE